jgi:hypothetical protein
MTIVLKRTTVNGTLEDALHYATVACNGGCGAIIEPEGSGYTVTVYRERRISE